MEIDKWTEIGLKVIEQSNSLHTSSLDYHSLLLADLRETVVGLVGKM